MLQAGWVAPGAHINAVGACTPAARELDSETVAKARLYVDSRQSAANEAGDFIIPRNEGLIDESHIVAELGELLNNGQGGRSAASDITLFKSLGLAVEDLAAADLLYRKLEATRAGTWVEMNAKRNP